jgi:hypothetical protein
MEDTKGTLLCDKTMENFLLSLAATEKNATPAEVVSAWKHERTELS